MACVRRRSSCSRSEGFGPESKNSECNSQAGRVRAGLALARSQKEERNQQQLAGRKGKGQVGESAESGLKRKRAACRKQAKMEPAAASPAGWPTTTGGPQVKDSAGRFVWSEARVTQRPHLPGLGLAPSSRQVPPGHEHTRPLPQQPSIISPYLSGRN